eukprot:263341_1
MNSVEPNHAFFCKCEQSCFGILYDILAQVISILDVATDIIVCIEFYQKERFVFFCVSLTILCLASLAYDIAFMINYNNESKIIRKALLFILVLPISPLVPFFMYFTADPKSKLSKFTNDNCCFKIYMSDRKTTASDVTKLKQFMEAKLKKHLGFIIEALVEAFPQAILQMIAIVMFKEADLISITSILISLLSLASKSFVFSIASALTLKQLFFNWLSAVTDFLGIFFAVSWVFYEPENEDLKHAFVVIQTIWLYRLYTCTIPLVGIFSVVFYLIALMESAPSQGNTIQAYVKWLLMMLCLFMGVTVMWAAGIIGAVLVFEIVSWTWFAFVFFSLGTQRFPENKIAAEFYLTVIGWIASAEKHRVGTRYKGVQSYSKYQDKMMRISAFHHVALESNWLDKYSDSHCKEYLTKERSTQYMNVTMKGLRIHSTEHNKSYFTLLFWRMYAQIWRDQKDDINRSWDQLRLNPTTCARVSKCGEDTFFAVAAWLLTFVCGPMYFMSRIWTTVLFPGYIVLYLYFGYGVNVWTTSDIDPFQVVMMSVYMGLCSVLWILFYFNCREQYLMHHILPSMGRVCYYDLTECKTEMTLKDTINHYYSTIVIPIRKAIVIDHFGSDLGPIILSYLPVHDEYESAHSNVVRIKTV